MALPEHHQNIDITLFQHLPADLYKIVTSYIFICETVDINWNHCIHQTPEEIFKYNKQYKSIHLHAGTLALGNGVKYNFEKTETIIQSPISTIKLQGDCSHMFYNASSFNSDISRWDVSGVTK